MTELERTIKVYGHAVVPAEPDELHLRFTISAVRSRQAEALQDVTARSQQLRDLLTQMDVPAEKRTTSGISVREVRDRVDERRAHRGYEAQTSILVRLDDAATAGPLLEAAVERADTHIDGPWWIVDPANPARLQACRDAMDDARRKAEEYARAASLSLGPIISITDQAESLWGGGRMLSGMAAAGAESMHVEPGTLDVAAGVTVTYGIES
jgi:uncharacterized protein YggE